MVFFDPLLYRFLVSCRPLGRRIFKKYFGQMQYRLLCFDIQIFLCFFFIRKHCLYDIFVCNRHSRL